MGICERPPSGQQRAETQAEGQNRLAERHEGRRTTASLTGPAQGLSLGWERLETKESRTNNRSTRGCFWDHREDLRGEKPASEEPEGNAQD